MGALVDVDFPKWNDRVSVEIHDCSTSGAARKKIWAANKGVVLEDTEKYDTLTRSRYAMGRLHSLPSQLWATGAS